MTEVERRVLATWWPDAAHAELAPVAQPVLGVTGISYGWIGAASTHLESASSATTAYTTAGSATWTLSASSTFQARLEA